MAFGFGDFLVGSPAIADAGRAAVDIVNAGNSAYDSEIQRQQALAKAGDDVLEREIKLRQLPTRIMSENLETAAKLNLLDPEPDEADFLAAKQEILGDKMTYKAEDVPKIQAKAMEIAKARRKNIDPFDPSSWFRDQGPQQITDAQLALLTEKKKAEAYYAREELKAKTRLEEQAMQTDAMMAKLGITLEHQDKQTNKRIGAQYGLQSQAQRFQEKEKMKARAEDALATMKKSYSAWNSPVGRPEVQKNLAADYDALLATSSQAGDYESAIAAWEKWGSHLKKLGRRPPPGASISNDIAAGYAAAVKSGGKGPQTKRDPKIEAYAKQYKLDYSKAESILRKRGYGAK